MIPASKTRQGFQTSVRHIAATERVGVSFSTQSAAQTNDAFEQAKRAQGKK